MKAALTCVLASSALFSILGGAFAAQGPGASPSPRDDPEQQRKALAQLMARKTRHTQDLIAALAVEDFARLADGAGALKQIGRDALWKVSPNLNYIKYGAEFTSIAEELERHARQKDLNGATLSYVRLTINCVECHKYVRDNRILDPKLHGR